MADQPPPQPYSDAELPGVIAKLEEMAAIAPVFIYARLAATLAELEQLRQDKERLTEVERLLTDYLAFSSIDGRAERQLLRSTMREWLASRSLPGALKEEKDNG